MAGTGTLGSSIDLKGQALVLWVAELKSGDRYWFYG